jgi:hypothetical protein
LHPEKKLRLEKIKKLLKEKTNLLWE